MRSEFKALSVVVVFFIGCNNGDADRLVQRDLHSIVLQYHQFATETGAPPVNSGQLIQFDPPYRELQGDSLDIEAMKNALQSDEYIVVWGYDVSGNGESNFITILAYQKTAPEKGGYVAYADGRTVYLEAAKFASSEVAEPKG